MDNLFEDVKREYINRYSETHGILLADDYDSFVTKMMFCIMAALNHYDDSGRKILNEFICEDLRNSMTPEQWQLEKAKLMKLIFFLALEECPPLKHEFATHLYNELRKEAVSEKES